MSTLTDVPDGDAREAEAEALDAYSRVVVDVAERLAPSVANLRTSCEPIAPAPPVTNAVVPVQSLIRPPR